MRGWEGECLTIAYAIGPSFSSLPPLRSLASLSHSFPFPPSPSCRHPFLCPSLFPPPLSLSQEEYYVTHQCFLSARSLYLVVWNTTQGEAGVNALGPWLHNIQVGEEEGWGGGRGGGVGRWERRRGGGERGWGGGRMGLEKEGGGRHSLDLQLAVKLEPTDHRLHVSLMPTLHTTLHIHTYPPLHTGACPWFSCSDSGYTL